MPAQRDVSWAEAEDKRRPMLIVTRTEAIPVLTWILVAPVTRTVRCISTEVNLEMDDCMPARRVAAFDNVQPIRKSFLTRFVASVAHP